MSGITYRPIHVWPREETRDRKRSRFRSGWSDTVELLKRELRMIGARNVVIQLDLREEDIRLDGLPRANARPSSPRVIISCETADGPLSFPCDTWDHWQDNVRAIALTLEHLRAIDRYGVTRHREQYRGWKALPPAGETSTTMTTVQAAGFVSLHCVYIATEILCDASVWRAAYREAAQRLHPDRGGSIDDFQTLQAAKRVLDKHHHLGGMP